MHPTGSCFPRTRVNPLLTLGAPDPPCCDKRFSPGTRGNGSGPRGRIWSSRAPGNRPRRRVSTLTGERGTRAGRRGSPQSEPCGLLRVGGVLGPPGGWTDSPGVDSDDPRPLCLPVSEREPTTKRACDDPQGLGAASVGPGKPKCAGGPALHSFKQQAQPANCREGHLPGAGRGGKLSKAPHAGRGPGVRAGSHQQPPAGCQLGVTGEAQNSRGNTETRDRHKKCEKQEAGGHTPPISKLAANCSYQDPLVLAHGQTRDEENRNERPGESLYIYRQVGWVTTLNQQGGSMGGTVFPTNSAGQQDMHKPRNEGAAPAHTRYKSEVRMNLGAACWCAESRPTLCDPRDCSPSGSSVHGILQARRLEWVAMPSCRGSS